MKFEKITFTHPRVVFGESTGMLSTEPNQASRQVDSLVGDGVWVVITRAGLVRVVPASSIEEAVPLPETLAGAELPEPKPAAKSSGSKPR